MSARDNDTALPLRPGEVRKPDVKQGESVKEVPINIYVNGQPVSLTRFEALGIIAQITQTMIYLEDLERKEKDGNRKPG